MPWSTYLVCAAGGAGLKAVTELQEMMYNTESGCLVFEATAFLSQDNARQLRAWHTELICAPAEGGGSTVRPAPQSWNSGPACTTCQPLRRTRQVCAQLH